MTIAYIFAYFGDGGSEENAFLLAQSAKKAGHKVIFIISSYSSSSILRLEKEGLESVILPMESSFGPLAVTRSAKLLGRTIRDKKIDIVHTHMLREQSLAIMAKIFGCRFILVRTFHRFDQFNNKMKLLMPLYRRFTNAFISISDGMSEYLAKNGVTKKVYLIKNGVPKVAALTHDKALGFIGRLSSEKGILKFVEANVELLQKTKLVIAGDGPDFDKIKKIVDKNRLNVRMIGKITDKAKFYKKISVLVLPSETEVLPLVVLEAFSCGLPVAAFDIKPLRELVANDNGCLAKFPDYFLLGEAAALLLKNPNKYHKTNYKKYKSEYSVERMWAHTGELYNDLALSYKKW